MQETKLRLLAKADLHILLVEDNRADQVLIERQLKRAAGDRMRLTHIRRLAELESTIQKHSIDLVLLDMNLPDSHDFSTFLRAFQNQNDLPIIIITGASDLTGPGLLAAGAEDFIRKDEITEQFNLVERIQFAIARSHYKKMLSEAAFIDDVMGAQNRRGFYRLVENHFLNSVDQYLIIYLDIKDFAQYKQRAGQQLADGLLRRVYTICQQVFRPGDIVSRFGPDEFVIFVPGGSGNMIKSVRHDLEFHTAAMNSALGEGEKFDLALGFAAGKTPGELENVIDQASRNLLVEQKKIAMGIRVVNVEPKRS